MNGLERLLGSKWAIRRPVRIVSCVCFQWGDSGKGKIADLLSIWADVNVKGLGGHNSGHTKIRNGRMKIYHLLPVGIEQDGQGKFTVLGSGMVISLPALVAELDELEAEGLSYNNLMISSGAHVITSYHLARDRSTDKSMKAGGIGSTGRGIGPCYGDKSMRRGVRIGDLFDVDVLAERIGKEIPYYPEQCISVDQVVAELLTHRDRIAPFVKNTTAEMRRFAREGKRIFIEGAQGLLLSVEHGTYPYVTSSDCSFNGMMSGVGLPGSIVDLPLGVVKFPYMTRVGGGPFPIELGGSRLEEYCASEDPEHNKKWELGQFGIPFNYDTNHPKILRLVNSIDPFLQGIGIRLAGNEYGATTGRPRRTGWTDAVAARYAVGINGPLIVITKPDVLAGTRSFKVAYGYEDGGVVTDKFDTDCKFLRRIRPQYREYKGFSDIQDVREYDDLPQSLKASLRDLEEFTGGNVALVSNGADTDQIIVKKG